VVKEGWKWPRMRDVLVDGDMQHALQAVYHLTAVTMFYFRDESCPPSFTPLSKDTFSTI
jgi:hypothetical protein